VTRSAAFYDQHFTASLQTLTGKSIKDHC